MVIVPDRHDTGTNALVVDPSGPFEPQFGPGSRQRHVEQAESRRLSYAIERPASLTIDVDTGDDLVALGVALKRFHGRARDARRPSADRAHAQLPDRRRLTSASTLHAFRLEAEPLAGLPEIRAGDDLAALISAAAEAAVAGLRGGEVLVVAQKVDLQVGGPARRAAPTSSPARVRGSWAQRRERIRGSYS